MGSDPPSGSAGAAVVRAAGADIHHNLEDTVVEPYPTTPTPTTPPPTTPPPTPPATPTTPITPAGTQAGQQPDPSLKGKAADTADAAKQAAGDVGQTAADKAKEVAGEAQRQARDLVGEARDQVNGQVSEQHRNLVGNLHSLADEFGRMAKASDQPGLASELVGQAGERARGAADWIGNRQPGELVDEVRSFARRRPGAFLLGAVVAGVAVGRLTRGVVAAHSDDSTPSSDSGTPPAHARSVDIGAEPLPADAGGYSSPPAPAGTSFRPPEPPAPAGPGSVWP